MRMRPAASSLYRICPDYVLDILFYLSYCYKRKSACQTIYTAVGQSYCLVSLAEAWLPPAITGAPQLRGSLRARFRNVRS